MVTGTLLIYSREGSRSEIGDVCITAKEGDGARNHGHRNKASLYVGGYLDVNRQPSLAVDRLSHSPTLPSSSG
jgi:hypothetical protein